MILVKNLKYKYFIFLFFPFLFSCNPTSTIKINGSTMGTTYEVTIKNCYSSIIEIKNDIDSLLVDINNVFSAYIPNSEISLINNSSLINIVLSDDFEYVLSKALFYCDLSEGLYDITVNPLVELWGFGKRDISYIPSNSEIKNKLKKIGYEKIVYKDKILYNKDNIQFDLNSIAKGYAVDRIYEYIINKGFNEFLVEIGGEVRSSSNDRGWVIGIQDPKSDSIIKKIKLKNKSLATSGTYNNYFVHKGVEYSHIINPKTGYPFKHRIISASIIADKCIDADALATLAMTMIPSDVIDIVNRYKGIDCYILEMSDDGTVIEFTSNSFKDFIF